MDVIEDDRILEIEQKPLSDKELEELEKEIDKDDDSDWDYNEL